MDKDLVNQVVDAAYRVVQSGAISANGHGNVSVRAPGSDEMYFTAGSSLRDHPASAVVRVRLDGTLLEGDLPPIQGAVAELGRPVEIPGEMRAVALQRAMTFDRRGTLNA